MALILQIMSQSVKILPNILLTAGENVRYNFILSNGTLEISGSGNMNNYSLPNSDAPWYSYKSFIETVVIDDGVTSIGAFAFYECTGLTSISIPDSVTSIGQGAFYGCTGLQCLLIHYIHKRLVH